MGPLRDRPAEINIMKWIRALMAVATVGLVAACGGGNSDTAATAPSTSATLDSALQSSGQTNTMSGAVELAGMASAMRGDTQYTLLMPTDEAMAPYAEELAELTKPENREALQRYLRAHMVDGKLLSEQLAAAAGSDTVTVRNVLGDTIELAVEEGSVKVNGAALLTKDIQAKNGALHIFAAPIFRPSVFGVVRVLPVTSTLEAAIRAADLRDTLRGDGPFTLFAPTNQAFESLLRELNLTAEQLLANKPLLTQVLTYHVLASQVLARQIEDGAKPTTVQGQAITLDVERGRRIEITDARGRTSNVIFTNLRASNGVVHLIDRVILPADMTPPPPPAPKSIVEIAAGNPDFSILVAAVQAAGLVDTLSGPGPFTVFAPTNAAFASLLAELNVTAEQLLANKPLLTQVLTYHVLAGRTLAADITNGLAASTVQGQALKFSRSASGVSITDASGRTSNIIATDIAASNGVIHVIDRVILPTSKTIVQLAVETPQLSILVEAVLAAQLQGVLSGTGPFTVFAPTNDAFAALLGELHVSKEALLANRDLLTQVLTYHVVPAQVLSSGIPFGQPVTSVQGQTFTIGRDLRITDQRGRQARIIATDIAASNGVVHVIDRVILPR
jgi:transforming growth factor-beta-induced protein